jgi:dUTP pyrophosphatase
MTEIRVKLRRLRPGAIVPQYHSPGAAAFDLHACLDEPLTIAPGATAMVPTGIALHLADADYGLCLWPRSGMDAVKCIGLGAGLVDSDYQGELNAVLINRNSHPFVVNHGDRICQGVVQPVLRAQFEEVEDFDLNTVRGTNGFGSTGT